MQIISTSVPATIKVAEFLNMDTAQHFDTTVSPTADGQFAIDEDVIRITGPFFTFANGTVGLFKGLHDRRVWRARNNEGGIGK